MQFLANTQDCAHICRSVSSFRVSHSLQHHQGLKEEEEETAAAAKGKEKEKEKEKETVKENKKLLTCNKLWLHSIVKWLRSSKLSNLK